MGPLFPIMLFVLLGAGFLSTDRLGVARDEKVLEGAHLKSDGESLLQFFRGRTLAEGDQEKVKTLIGQLGSPSYRERDQAAHALIAKGSLVVSALRAAISDPTDLEVVRRAELCLAKIEAKDLAVDVPVAAARLLAVKKPAGAVQTLLAFMPFANNDYVAEEVRATLIKMAVSAGKVDPALTAGLGHKDPARRATAGEVLVRAAPAKSDDRAAAQKLLHDEAPLVRWRVATALAHAADRDAVPVLIDLLPLLSLSQAWQAEDILFRLAEDQNPPAVSLGTDQAARKKCRDAWTAWWKEHGGKINLARLSETPPLLGYTLIILLDQNRVLELDANKQVRWQVDQLVFPLDVQYLPAKTNRAPEDRVLVAEYHASRVTERTLKGAVVWEKRIGAPIAAQRLPNGNTFIVTNSQFLEFDKNDKEVLNVSLPNGDRILKAAKLNNGEIGCLTQQGRFVRLDAKGKEVNSFPVTLGMKLSGGRIYPMANGHVLIPHNAENKVSEYDATGKEIWSVKVDQPVAASRLANGNTLVTTMLPQRGAVEFDRAGNEVWNYRTDTRVTRALRR